MTAGTAGSAGENGSSRGVGLTGKEGFGMEWNMDEVHAVQLEMLKAVDRLCEKHGIRYWIYCGTLLGAVRHWGFIPWDDDVDLAMFRKDYRRFQEVADELPEPFRCCHMGNTREFYLPWTQVINENTTCMDTAVAALNVPHGMSLDIYPLVGAARCRFGILLQRAALFTARCLRAVSYYQARGDRDIIRRILYLVPYPVRRGISAMILRMAMLDPEKHQKIGTVDAAPFDGKFEKKDWDGTVRLHFEDGMFPAPAKYKLILSYMYGNYKQLPPEDQRKYHNWVYGELIMDPHRSYREYREAYLKDRQKTIKWG